MPAIIGAERDGMQWYAHHYAWTEAEEPDLDDDEHEFSDHLYLHRDAARAWQALRDWLNATKEYEA
jgi:hypothetical protein